MTASSDTRYYASPSAIKRYLDCRRGWRSATFEHGDAAETGSECHRIAELFETGFSVPLDLIVADQEIVQMVDRARQIGWFAPPGEILCVESHGIPDEFVAIKRGKLMARVPLTEDFGLELICDLAWRAQDGHVVIDDHKTTRDPNRDDIDWQARGSLVTAAIMWPAPLHVFRALFWRNGHSERWQLESWDVAAEIEHMIEVLRQMRADREVPAETLPESLCRSCQSCSRALAGQCDAAREVVTTELVPHAGYLDVQTAPDGVRARKKLGHMVKVIEGESARIRALIAGWVAEGAAFDGGEKVIETSYQRKGFSVGGTTVTQYKIVPALITTPAAPLALPQYATSFDVLALPAPEEPSALPHGCEADYPTVEGQIVATGAALDPLREEFPAIGRVVLDVQPATTRPENVKFWSPEFEREEAPMSPPPAPATEPAEDQSGAINRSPTTGFAAVPGHELPLAAAPINAAVPPVAEASADPGAPSAEPGGEATPPPEPAAEAADVEAECYICHGLISCSACCPRKPGQRGSDKAPRAVRLPNGWRWDRAQDGPVQTRDDADPLTDEQIDAVRESRRKLAAAPVQPAAPDELLMADAEHEVKP